MNGKVCLALLALSVATVSAKECYDEAKADELKAYLAQEFKKMCDSGIKPGTKPAHVDYAKKLYDQGTSKDFLGNVEDVPRKDAIFKAGKDCHAKLKDKDLCNKDSQKKMKECLVGKLLMDAPGVMGWWEKSCPIVDKHLIQQTQPTKAKIDKMIAGVPK
ncbi:hypothetical protein HDE_04890 [Halotydeus destructor]|nr:hypothetical protein HDE_04890 [Halotydeus destructor]